MRILFLPLLALVAFASCKPEFEKGRDGLEYRIISKGKGESIQPGEYLQFHIAQFYNTGRKDSLLTDSREGMPVFEQLDSATIPPVYYDVISQLRIGDSVIMRILSDTMFKDQPDMMPPFMKKGRWLTTTIKVLNIVKTEAEKDSMRQAATIALLEKQAKEDAAQVEKDDDILKQYFAKNKITPQKSPRGMYVEMLEPGTGALLDTSVIAKVNYTGRLLDGKVFDSNTDPAFNHPEPFFVNLTDNTMLGNSVITGWSEGLQMLKKGSKAKFYIPSGLAYGRRGAGRDIPPHSILVFDIEVLDVETRDQAAKRLNIDPEVMKQHQNRNSIQEQLRRQIEEQLKNGQELEIEPM